MSKILIIEDEVAIEDLGSQYRGCRDDDVFCFKKV